MTALQDLTATSPTTTAASPWLSVLVPVFNVQVYLRESIESVLQQLPNPADGSVEILLLDDASTDDSAQIAAQLQQQWPQAVHVLQHPQNRGISAARNSLLEHAQGQYLWFLDSDDCLMPGALATLKQVVDAHQPDIVMCDFRLWRTREKLKHRLRGERHRHSFAPVPARNAATVLVQDQAALLSGMLLSGQLHPWSKITKRSLWQATATLDAVRFPAVLSFEDMAAIPRVLLRARSFVYIPEVWIAYRQREGSLLASMNAQKALNLGAALDVFGQEYQACAAAQPELASPAVRFAIAHLAARNYLGSLRALQRSGAEVTTAQRRALANSFLNTSPLSVAQLQQQYLRRGWWARYWRARSQLQDLQKDASHG